MDEIKSVSYLNFAVDSDGPIEDTVHAENGRLRRIDNRSAEQGTENASVGNGEGAAVHVFHRQFARTRETGKARQFALNLTHVINLIVAEMSRF